MTLWDDAFRARLLRQALSTDEIQQAVDAAELAEADRERLDAVRVAAAELLADDGWQTEWADCACSWCVRRRALRDALAAADGTPA